VKNVLRDISGCCMNVSGWSVWLEAISSLLLLWWHDLSCTQELQEGVVLFRKCLYICCYCCKLLFVCCSLWMLFMA